MQRLDADMATNTTFSDTLAWKLDNGVTMDMITHDSDCMLQAKIKPFKILASIFYYNSIKDRAIIYTVWNYISRKKINIKLNEEEVNALPISASCSRSTAKFILSANIKFWYATFLIVDTTKTENNILWQRTTSGSHSRRDKAVTVQLHQIKK